MAGQTKAGASVEVKGRCHCGAISYVAHIMTAERLGWLDGVEDLPKFRTYPGMD